jgi:hypothetical protein
MREVDHIGIVSDEMCEVVEELWPELARKLPPKAEPVPRAPLGSTTARGDFHSRRHSSPFYRVP